MGIWKGKQDAWGQALYDHQTGMDRGAVIERHDGFIEPVHSCDSYFADHKSWPQHQVEALRLARGKALDIGCGAGRIALHLQSKGLDVLGIDNSALAVKVCRLRGLKKSRAMSITQLSSKLGIFDTILMIGNNFGLFGNCKRARWLLRRFSAMTSPRARIITETLDPYDTKSPVHLAYHKSNRRRGRMPGQIRLRIRYSNMANPYHDWLFVSKEEMASIVAGTGWQIGRFCDAKGSAYIAVLDKEPER